MRKNTFYVLCLALFSVLSAAPARAGFEVFPAPDVVTGDVGDVVTVEVRYEPLVWPVIVGGGFDVVFNPSFLAFVDHAYTGFSDPDYEREPELLPGRIAGFSVGQFSGLVDPGTMVTVRFRILRAGASRVAAVESVIPFLAWTDTYELFVPVYGASLVASTGTAYPQLVLPRVINFGVVEPGALALRDLIVSNIGTGPLEIYRTVLVAVSNTANPNYFSIVQDNCIGTTLPPDGQCAIELLFMPPQVEPFRQRSAAVLLKTSDLIDYGPRIFLAGEIAAPFIRAPSIEIEDASSVPPFTTATAVLENTGQLPGVIDQIADIAAPFTLVDDQCTGVTLSPLEQCSFGIQFAPRASGLAYDWYDVTYGGVFMTRARITGDTAARRSR